MAADLRHWVSISEIVLVAGGIFSLPRARSHGPHPRRAAAIQHLHGRAGVWAEVSDRLLGRDGVVSSSQGAVRQRECALSQVRQVDEHRGLRASTCHW